MSEDARFLDGGEKPLNLAARDQEDLRVLSSLVQDAVFPITEMKWQARNRIFAVLVNRFRWERPTSNLTEAERVQSVLAIENVVSVSSFGIDRSDKDTVLSLLGLELSGDADGQGELVLHLAGDGAIKLVFDGLECRLKDVTRPYSAPSGKVPSHEGL